MKVRLTLVFVVALATLMSGCASGSAIVTGKRRPPISPEQVKIYVDAPLKFETIGIVRAKSGAGCTMQGSVDYAMAELKEQAAKLGANGILLSAPGTEISGVIVPGYTGMMGGISHAQVVEGRAIYVTQD